MKITRPILKVGTFLAINSQDDFNELAVLSGAFEVDSLHIDCEYVAYLDFDGSVSGMIYVVPLQSFKEENPNMEIKPRKLKSWKRSLKCCTFTK